MFPQLDASSDKLRRFSANISTDQSCCSSDTGDVLIRSTRVRHDTGAGPGSVRITVQRVRDPTVQPPVAERQQQKADSAPPLRAAVHSQPGKSFGRLSRSSCGLSRVNWQFFDVCACVCRQTDAAETSTDQKEQSESSSSSDHLWIQNTSINVSQLMCWRH